MSQTLAIAQPVHVLELKKGSSKPVVYNFVKDVQFGNCPVYVWVENWGALS